MCAEVGVMHPDCVDLSTALLPEGAECMQCGKAIPAGDVGVWVELVGCGHEYGSCVDCVLWNLLRAGDLDDMQAFMDSVDRVRSQLN